MKADKIFKNAKIFTSDCKNPKATALVVKDGKFVYVGDEAGLSAYEGEVVDLGGKFIMPGIFDSHVHVTLPVGFAYSDTGERFACNGKQEALDFMANYIAKNPGRKCYRFILEKKDLLGETLTYKDLDAICPDADLQIQEAEFHSVWVNSRVLKRHGITDDTPDPVPGLSVYERKDGHVTGYIIEGSAETRIILDGTLDLTDEQIDAALQSWIDFSVEHGVTAVFDAGIPGFPEAHEHIMKRLCALDKQGKLPVYVDNCYVIAANWQAEDGLKELKRFRKEYSTPHHQVHTMKIFMDGTQKIRTAAMLTPYEGTQEKGATAFNKEDLAALMVKLNAEGLDLHMHTVGSAASHVALDAVEIARKELGDKFTMKVTCAHLEVQDDADMGRFAKLGVIANYTPWWHAADPQVLTPVIGYERARKMFRCKTMWDSGALVTWSSDNVVYDFPCWNPFLGMEVGMTRQITEKTNSHAFTRTTAVFPPENERMGIEEMLLGYTINGAKQLGVEATKGSITVGKDADFLVLEKDLLTQPQEGFSFNLPQEVYFGGKKVN